MISVGKKKLVRSVPTELNKDHNQIFELAQVTSILYQCFPFPHISFRLFVFAMNFLLFKYL